MAEMDREHAKAAGLLTGTCRGCGDDIWSDRHPDAVRSTDFVWHRDCAEQARDQLDEALR